MIVKEITYKEAVDFLLPKHYSGRIPSVHKAFGWFKDGELKAVITYGKPASPSLCRGICGDEYKDIVWELNRMCRTEDLTEPLSKFVSETLKLMKPSIIVSYSDTAMNHHGYVYQACNFIYTGFTKERTDKWTSSGKHSRHYKNEEQGEYRKVRSSKFRYVYFCGSKTERKKWMKALKYPIIKEYPKGDNSNYILGDYIKEKLVKNKKYIDNDKEIVYNIEGMEK